VPALLYGQGTVEGGEERSGALGAAETLGEVEKRLGICTEAGGEGQIATLFYPEGFSVKRG